jgi:hypothetical protein
MATHKWQAILKRRGKGYNQVRVISINRRRIIPDPLP